MNCARLSIRMPRRKYHEDDERPVGKGKTEPNEWFRVTRPVGNEEWGQYDKHGLSKHFLCKGSGTLPDEQGRKTLECPNCLGDGMRRRPHFVDKALN